MKNLANFPQSPWKSQNWYFHWVLFLKSIKCMSLKLIGEFRVMAMKSDTKFQKELTCQFKTDMRNLTNFDPNPQKSQEFAL